MSSQQQALFLDTIVAVRKALKRKAYESDSDDSIEHKTNRGFKLKKRARFVQKGHLAPPTGPASYREVVEYANYHRAIISRNPPLIDEEGYEIDSGDDEDQVQAAMIAAADENPYSEVQLEKILAPLTSVTELPSHPTLSKPYTSKALTQLTDQGCDLMHREQAALWKVKPLLTKLHGDHIWANCGLMVEEEDQDYFTEESVPQFLNKIGKASTIASTSSSLLNGEASRLSTRAITGSAHENGLDSGAELREDDSAADSGADRPKRSKSKKGKDADLAPVVNGHGQVDDDSGKKDRKKKDTPPATGAEVEGAHTNGKTAPSDGAQDGPGSAKNSSSMTAGPDGADVDMLDASEQPSLPANGPSAMSSALQLVGSRALSLTPVGLEGDIHPIFRPPPAARADRDQGLVDHEAEEVRRLLQLYVQKQEEVVRGTRQLHEGLLKADRLRQEVLRWAKAEAHSGSNRDMSDGEDWYDKDEWGLTEDLKKGQDEEEEDTVQTQKKTRARR